MKKTLLLAASALLPLSAIAADAGWFGMAINTNISWKMELESATLREVVAQSPAAKAGLANGDAIVRIENCAIPGCGVRKAQKLIEREAGEKLRLELQRADGSRYQATLTAEPRPAR